MNRSFVVDVLCVTVTLMLAAVVFAALAVPMVRAAAPPFDEENRLGGQMEATVGGLKVQFPALKTDISADIAGDVATVTIVQTFVNPAGQPLNATYLFPLNKDAAVHAMRMRVGDELISAVIEKRQAARQTFERAKRQGKAAALLEQHRPNMFTQSVANLMPGQPIKITLQYVQPVPRVDGAYQLVVPLVVGPRYIPAGSRPLLASRTVQGPQDRPYGSGDKINDAGNAAATGVTADEQLQAGQGGLVGTDGQGTAGALAGALGGGRGAKQLAPGGWQLGAVPDYPEVAGLTIPRQVDADRVSIKVSLSAGMAISTVVSPSHAIAVDGDGDGDVDGSGAADSHRRNIRLAGGKTIDNSDFILEYRIAGEGVEAGVLSHRDASGGYLSVMIEPPALVDAGQVTPREIVFILDTSGSMSGAPMAASKQFMRHSLKALRAHDYFRIIRFSNQAGEFSHQPVRASAENLERAMAFVDQLRAGGGTEVMSGLNKAFGSRQVAGTRRLIVFLSDGYVGNEAEILHKVSSSIGFARTFALGVGTSVNRYLLAEMAHHGRGYARFIDPTEKVEDAAIKFANKLSHTVMTDLEIDWGGLEVSDIVPAQLPDLFAGDAIRVHARSRASGKHTIRVKGRINGRPAVLPVQIELPAAPTGESTKALALTWARAQIKDLMRQAMVPARMREGGRSADDIEELVTEIGLKHALVTQWTSFVAVSQQVINHRPEDARDAAVPLPMVKGVGKEAYGKQGQRAQGLSPVRRATVQGRVRVASAPNIQNFGSGFAGGSTPEPEHLLGLMTMLLMLLGGGRLLTRRRA